jgi:hypothetical protein
VLCLGLNPNCLSRISPLRRGREVMGEENRIDDLDQELYRSLGEMLQSRSLFYIPFGLGALSTLRSLIAL